MTTAGDAVRKIFMNKRVSVNSRECLCGRQTARRSPLEARLLLRNFPMRLTCKPSAYPPSRNGELFEYIAYMGFIGFHCLFDGVVTFVSKKLSESMAEKC